MALRSVSVLCCRRDSEYKRISGVDVFDQVRNARWFEGSNALVCHPPCGPWSGHCSHQAKGELGERSLGPFCVSLLRRNGGVLEHPAHSRLWGWEGLPEPGHGVDGVEWSIEIEQGLFGYRLTRKRTWICFFGVRSRDVPAWSLSLWSEGGEERRWQGSSERQRSLTVLEFGEWLVSAAERSVPPGKRE